mmetsp:Transcript_13524/g.36501  ORF Transcript_13524/g.36501 Transcript_13524/m.36501 type:complete len:329 (-) Transcript_13524:16-1002(-)
MNAFASNDSSFHIRPTCYDAAKHPATCPLHNFNFAISLHCFHQKLDATTGGDVGPAFDVGAYEALQHREPGCQHGQHMAMSIDGSERRPDHAHRCRSFLLHKFLGQLRGKQLATIGLCVSVTEAIPHRFEQILSGRFGIIGRCLRALGGLAPHVWHALGLKLVLGAETRHQLLEHVLGPLSEGGATPMRVSKRQRHGGLSEASKSFPGPAHRDTGHVRAGLKRPFGQHSPCHCPRAAVRIHALMACRRREKHQRGLLHVLVLHERRALIVNALLVQILRTCACPPRFELLAIESDIAAQGHHDDATLSELIIAITTRDTRKGACEMGH